MNRYLICVDQSTTSTKVFLYDTKGILRYKTARKHRQLYPQASWVEHDPMEIYEHMIEGIHEVMQQADGELLGICLTNQRETIVLWDKKSGLPIGNAIVWQCRRTAAACEELKRYEAIVEEKTGLKIDPYFSATKLKWLLDHCDQPIESLCAGTIDSWLLYKLTGTHVCDPTNASRTLLYHLKEGVWDQELLTMFQIPKEILPRIIASDGDFGTAVINGVALPILSVMGDSQSALVGHDALQVGDVKITLGTGSSVMMNQGERILQNAYGVVSALAYQTSNHRCFASEAIINCSADTLNWLRDDLALFTKDEQLNSLSMDSHGVYLVPAFVGLGIPYWNARAKACISGISRNTTKEDILCAGLQSIVFQIYDALTALQKHTGVQASRVSVDGGASGNPVLMQLLSDLCNVEVVTYVHSDFSALGVVKLALAKMNSADCIEVPASVIYQPVMEHQQRQQLLNGWKQAIDMVLYDSERR